MHGSYSFLDLNWYLQFIITALAISFGLLFIVKNTASKYFLVDDVAGTDESRFGSSSPSSSSSPLARTSSPSSSSMPGRIAATDACVVCGSLTKKYCSRCKLVRYCSEKCQRSHWFSGHKEKCEDFRLSCKSNLEGRRTTAVAATSEKILFPYDEFVDLFNWKKPGFRPCGLLNCGNSCFANVVLQCLAFTRPLAAYLLEKGHKRGCRRNDWCFLCELQTHVERACQSIHAFSPINILSRLPNIGGNLGYGKQEDAHEFMRFAIDTMQSVCLDEYGGERAVHPSAQETTLIQHIFGGRLQSEVICTKCNNVSKQFENMMDLTVEIQGDAASLEECLDQFTAKEWLDGDNKYKCDGCNEYVLAWKRLNIRLPPNILTIALKRFQSGRFGKLNKRVTFPETLDLSPYMSESGDGNDKYMLYAVVVHVDMLNASFFGHYICYTKDFSGNWYRIDDCKVTCVEVDEVLSQGAYMLLYSRVSVRSSCLNPIEESSRKHDTLNASPEKLPSGGQTAEHSLAAEVVGASGMNSSLQRDNTAHSNVLTSQNSSSVIADVDMADSEDVSVLEDAGDCGTSSAFAHTGADLPVEDVSTFSSWNNCPATCSSNTLAPTHTELAFPLSGNGNRYEANGTGSIKCMQSNDLQNTPVSVQNHVSDNSEIVMGVSAATSSIHEEVRESDSTDSGCKPEKAEVTMIPLSNSEDASGKLEKTGSSGARLKPIFAPGFLGRRPVKTIKNKQDWKPPASSVEGVPRLSSSNNSLTTLSSTEATVPECMEPPLPVSDFEKGNETDADGPAECVPMTGLANSSIAIHSYASENGENDMGVSASSLCEEADKVDSVDSGYKSEKAESAMCLESMSSTGARLKPIFSPGFLVKRPLKNVIIKQEGTAPPESDIKEDNGKPVSPYQSIEDKEDETKGIRKPAVKSCSEGDMVNGEPIVVLNGDCIRKEDDPMAVDQP